MKAFNLLILAVCILLTCVMLASCADTTDVPRDTTSAQQTSATDTAITEPSDNVISIAERDQKSDFQIVYNLKDDSAGKYAARILNVLKNHLNVSMRLNSDYLASQEIACEILVGADMRPECAALTQTLEDNEYALKVVSDGDRTKVIIAYKGVYALMCAVDRLIEQYVDIQGGSFKVPADLDVRGKYTEQDILIVSSIEQLRDPCILVEDGIYYAYGTGWVCYKNTSGDLRGDWQSLGVVAQKPSHADNNYWAPEVHKYNGAYYMFTTYHSSVTNHRGCTIMKSDSPEGPFVEITDGQITPHDWDCIDGTFYVAPDGQPWMVFVHEWTSTDDGIGRMAAAKLSDDLTHFISEPVELFRADDPTWARAQVTDGCWMYRCEDGQLLMLWSNSDAYGYCVGIARSADGRVDGEWTQDSELLYSRNMLGQYDGGHGMLFYDTDGQMYLSIHSPNKVIGDRKETPVFIPVREQNGTLVWDIWKGEE